MQIHSHIRLLITLSHIYEDQWKKGNNLKFPPWNYAIWITSILKSLNRFASTGVWVVGDLPKQVLRVVPMPSTHPEAPLGFQECTPATGHPLHKNRLRYTVKHGFTQGSGKRWRAATWQFLYRRGLLRYHWTKDDDCKHFFTALVGFVAGNYFF